MSVILGDGMAVVPPEQAAAGAGISMATLRRLIRRDEVQVVRVLGRTMIRESDVVRIAERRRGATAPSPANDGEVEP
ncbi:MAG: helix-turn-helix domain-containing protein [Deltaproteobacteria bacterium]|nr:helix-turn-helix domain-containing protein [Deltaproteobacteria bacterium]